MQRLVLKIEESRFQLLLQFLKTLDYVKIIQPSTEGVQSNEPGAKSTEKGEGATSQLTLLQQQLQKQTSPLFQNIPDPVIWQNQQRNEWS